MTQLYTASRLRLWRSCQRAAHYRYALRIQTPPSHAMEFGTLLHKALEAYYVAWKSAGAGYDHRLTGEADDTRLTAALAVIDFADCTGVDRIKLRTLVTAYHLRWGSEPWEVIAVEQEFTYWLGDVQIGGKIDALIRDTITGRALVVEHKTSTQDTSPGSPYWEKLTLDTQISIYLDAARYALDLDVAGCIYDVLKRPLHEPLEATPEESRKYTVGKGCRACGGSAGGKAGIVQGRGHKIVAFASVVETPSCDDCKGTGWKCDEHGVPQAPRLHANQRDRAETLDEFADRLASVVAAAPDDFLARGVVVRLAHELPQMRQELLDTIAAMQACEAAGVHPPNPSACFVGRERCGYFAACSGQADITDEHLYPRGDTAHPELTAA